MLLSGHRGEARIPPNPALQRALGLTEPSKPGPSIGYPETRLHGPFTEQGHPEFRCGSRGRTRRTGTAGPRSPAGLSAGTARHFRFRCCLPERPLAGRRSHGGLVTHCKLLILILKLKKIESIFY